MKIILSLLIVLLFTNIVTSQNTAIPDANFEQELIILGLDAVIGGQVLTANIDTVTTLYLPWIWPNWITNLTGIEDFISLNHLTCFGQFQLSNLDVTQNIALTYLDCSGSSISNIDLSQNVALTTLHIDTSLFTSLDVSQNTALEVLSCGGNSLISLDLSLNTALTSLSAWYNQLTCLNVKNGNNTIIQDFETTGNFNLNCIQVDNISYSNSNWTDIDSQTSFSTICSSNCTVGIEENNLSNISLYPNPTTGSINIDFEEKKSNINLRITNDIGQVILTENYKSTNHINFDLYAPKGVYFLKLESDREVITKKIIKE